LVLTSWAFWHWLVPVCWTHDCRIDGIRVWSRCKEVAGSRFSEIRVCCLNLSHMASGVNILFSWCWLCPETWKETGATILLRSPKSQKSRERSRAPAIPESQVAAQSQMLCRVGQISRAKPLSCLSQTLLAGGRGVALFLKSHPRKEGWKEVRMKHDLWKHLLIPISFDFETSNFSVEQHMETTWVSRTCTFLQKPNSLLGLP
jgi:hypothetical protein